MKRVVSFLLAAAMTVSMASVAFAAPTTPKVYIDDNSALYYYDSDTGRLENATGHEFKPGEAIYIQIKGDGVDKSESYRSMHVYADWDVGSNLVESMDIVYKKVDTVTDSEYVLVGNTKPTGMKDSYETEEALKADAVKAFKGGYKEVTAGEGYTKVENDVTKYYTKAELVAAMKLTDAGAGYVKEGTFYKSDAALTEVTRNGQLLYAPKNWADGEKGYSVTLTGWKQNDGTVYVEVDASTTEAVDCKSQSEGSYTVPKTDGYVNDARDKWAADLAAAGFVEVNAQTAWIYDNGLYSTKDAAAQAAKYTIVPVGGWVNENGTYVAESNLAGYAGATTNVAGFYNKTSKAFMTSAELETAANAYAEQVAKNNYQESKTTVGKYNYVVEIVTVDSTTTRVRDLAGDVRIATTKSKDVPTCKLGIEIKNPKYKDGDPVDSVYIDKDSGEVVKFADDADVIDIEFGEDALFTVNVNGQSELNLGYSTKFNSEFASKYDDANIDFISWGATPSFNRIGDLYIFADEDSYIYEVTADGAKEVANAEYDDDYGAWHIRTRTLKSYAISDMKLKTTSTSSSSSSTSTPSGGGSGSGKPNPNTGR